MRIRVSKFVFCSFFDLRFFREHLSNLRTIMISRMAKPEEVLVVENDQGEVRFQPIELFNFLTLSQFILTGCARDCQGHRLHHIV